MYLSYSLSSSTDSLKIEPYMICASENNEYVKVGMINAYKSVHWGSRIISNHQNSYLMFNERDLPQFALVTIYLQLPHYEFPNMLKGLYLCLDYNHNPIARRIVLVKQSDSTDVNQFLEMEGCLVPRAELTRNWRCTIIIRVRREIISKRARCLHLSWMRRIWRERRRC